MAHLAKYKATAVGRLCAHYRRWDVGEGGGVWRANVDAARTPLNYVLGDARASWAEVARRMAEAERATGRRVRKDAVVMADAVVTLPRDVRPGDERAFFEATYAYMADAVGRDNLLGGYVHMDEKTPHVHIPFTPVVDGRFAYKSLCDRRFYQGFHKGLGAAVERALGYAVEVELSEERKGERPLSRVPQAELDAARAALVAPAEGELRAARASARQARAEAAGARKEADEARKAADAARRAQASAEQAAFDSRIEADAVARRAASERAEEARALESLRAAKDEAARAARMAEDARKEAARAQSAAKAAKAEQRASEEATEAAKAAQESLAASAEAIAAEAARTAQEVLEAKAELADARARLSAVPASAEEEAARLREDVGWLEDLVRWLCELVRDMAARLRELGDRETARECERDLEREVPEDLDASRPAREADIWR